MSESASHTGSICVLPKLEGLGGPSSFQSRLISGLVKRGVSVHHNPDQGDVETILVVGGISRLDILWKARRRGIRIVQRLNGMNWIHRKSSSGKRHYLRAEWYNWILATVRRRLADAVVYQSQFARTWWHTVYGPDHASASVIYNGVDLKVFTPDGPENPPADVIRIMLVEGRMAGGYERGLNTAVTFASLLDNESPRPVELMVVGEVRDGLRQRYERSEHPRVCFTGVVQRNQVPELDRAGHLLFSVDLNAACPNSVIEALACGLPVIAFATGSLPELIDGNAGKIVPYGSNYWNLEPPDVSQLVGAAGEILAEQERFRRGARARAEAAFNVDDMVEAYEKILFPE